MTANAVCRLCTVEVVGSRTLQPACVAQVQPDMIVNTETERVLTARRVLLELLASTVDLHEAPEIQEPDRAIRRRRDAFRRWQQPPFEVLDDNPFYVRDYSQCVMCWRCIQVCAEDVQYTFALTFGRPRPGQPRRHLLRRGHARHHLRLLRQLRRRLPDGRAEGEGRG